MSARHFEGADHASLYAKFRPVAPQSLATRIIEFLKEKHPGTLSSFVDVGCGSGQSTQILATYFTSATGVDISEAQIDEATKQNSSQNISYSVSPAESLPFANESVQLVTAGTACHWFDIPKFLEEVDRILVPNGVVALYTYQLPRMHWGEKTKELSNLIKKLYSTDLKSLFGKEVEYVDNAYTDKQFATPYDDRVREQGFTQERESTVRDMEGWISSWSGFQNYKAAHGEAAAKSLMGNFIKSVMDTIGVKTAPEDTKITLSIQYILIMGRKPSA